MPEQITVRQVYEELRRHVSECMEEKKMVQKQLEALGAAQTATGTMVTAKFDDLNKAGWKWIGALVIAIIASGAAVGFQSYALHKNTADKAESAAIEAHSAVVATTTNQSDRDARDKEIIDKLNELTAKNK